jgi:hypothetical protein
MNKDDKSKDFGRKSPREACKIPRDCNISEPTDSVEFASEPLAGTDRKKGADKRDNRCK